MCRSPKEMANHGDHKVTHVTKCSFFFFHAQTETVAFHSQPA